MDYELKWQWHRLEAKRHELRRIHEQLISAGADEEAIKLVHTAEMAVDSAARIINREDTDPSWSWLMKHPG